jgi:hypothetical protein
LILFFFFFFLPQEKAAAVAKDAVNRWTGKHVNKQKA